jgi:hypothetical protein
MGFSKALATFIHMFDTSKSPDLTFDFVKTLMWYSARSILGSVFHTLELQLVSFLWRCQAHCSIPFL